MEDAWDLEGCQNDDLNQRETKGHARSRTKDKGKGKGKSGSKCNSASSASSDREDNSEATSKRKETDRAPPKPAVPAASTHKKASDTCSGCGADDWVPVLDDGTECCGQCGLQREGSTLTQLQEGPEDVHFTDSGVRVTSGVLVSLADSGDGVGYHSAIYRLLRSIRGTDFLPNMVVDTALASLPRVFQSKVYMGRTAPAMAAALVCAAARFHKMPLSLAQAASLAQSPMLQAGRALLALRRTLPDLLSPHQNTLSPHSNPAAPQILLSPHSFENRQPLPTETELELPELSLSTTRLIERSLHQVLPPDIAPPASLQPQSADSAAPHIQVWHIRLRDRIADLLRCATSNLIPDGRKPTALQCASIVIGLQAYGLWTPEREENLIKFLQVSQMTFSLRLKELRRYLLHLTKSLPWGNDTTLKTIQRHYQFLLEHITNIHAQVVRNSTSKTAVPSYGTTKMTLPPEAYRKSCKRKHDLRERLNSACARLESWGNAHPSISPLCNKLLPQASPQSSLQTQTQTQTQAQAQAQTSLARVSCSTFDASPYPDAELYQLRKKPTNEPRLDRCDVDIECLLLQGVPTDVILQEGITAAFRHIQPADNSHEAVESELDSCLRSGEQLARWAQQTAESNQYELPRPKQTEDGPASHTRTPGQTPSRRKGAPSAESSKPTRVSRISYDHASTGLSQLSVDSIPDSLAQLLRSRPSNS